MVDYQHSNSAKLSFCDRLYPLTGLYGHLAIIDALLLTSAAFTVDAATDTLTFTAANKLVTGSRLRITSTTTIPGGLLSATDYFAIRISTTQFKLASTLANAIAGTPINITDAGSGVLNAFEQALTADDSMAVLIAHELVNTAYTTRFTIENLGASTIVSGDAQKSPWLQIFANNSGVSIVSAHRIIVYGGVSTIGSTAGTGYSLHTEQLTIFSSETKSFSIFFMR